MRWGYVLVGLLLVVASLGAALSHVRTSLIEQGRQQERQEANDAAAERVREANRHGSQLAATARAEAQSARDYAARLHRELRDARHAQNLVVPEVAAAAAAAAPGAAASAPSPDVAVAAAPGGGLRLSAGAVRLWDSALAGADVPAGACGSADPTARACAAASAYDIQHAWDNHIENAARCREDRARYRRLIEFVQARNPSAAAP